MADYGIKITRDGYSITSTNPRDYVFSSKYSAVKIVGSGTGTLTVAASSGNSVSINHNQSFVPMTIFYCELKPGSGKWFMGAVKLNSGDADAGDCYVDTALVGSSSFDYGYTYVDSSVFRLYIRNAGAYSQDIDYRYVFFGDTGES